MREKITLACTEDCSLIHLFNEDNLIIDKMKKAKNKVPKY